MRETELLIPVGSLDVLKTTIVFDTDTVYIGGKALGLRAKAHNFSRNDMEEGIAFAHARGVRVYMTADILTHNGDLPGVEVYFGELKEIGPDALIISDPGVFVAAKKVLSGMEIHTSTQVSNTNYGIYLFWYELGTGRVVTVRELPLDEIREIREYTPEDMEIKSFIYGVMCISYSERCLSSNFFVGRGANQGAYTHPYRWKYSTVEKAGPGGYMPVYENERGTYIFNSKDLRMTGHISEMMDAGINSFKIEGRMKTALYVATVVRAYRKVINDHRKDPQLCRDHMERYRQGIGKCTYREFTTRFYFGKPIEDTQIYDNNTYVENYAYLGIALGVDGRRRCLIQQKNRFCVGDTIEVTRPDGRNLELIIAGTEDEEGGAQDNVPHPKQVLRIDLGMDTDLEVCDILRKKEEGA